MDSVNRSLERRGGLRLLSLFVRWMHQCSVRQIRVSEHAISHISHMVVFATSDSVSLAVSQ